MAVAGKRSTRQRATGQRATGQRATRQRASRQRAGKPANNRLAKDDEPQDVLMALARAHTRQAFGAILAALDDENARIRIAAGELILAYGHGKPPARLEAGGDDLGALIRRAWAEGGGAASLDAGDPGSGPRDEPGEEP